MTAALYWRLGKSDIQVRVTMWRICWYHVLGWLAFLNLKCPWWHITEIQNWTTSVCMCHIYISLGSMDFFFIVLQNQTFLHFLIFVIGVVRADYSIPTQIYSKEVSINFKLYNIAITHTRILWVILTSIWWKVAFVYSIFRDPGLRMISCGENIRMLCYLVGVFTIWHH